MWLVYLSQGTSGFESTPLRFAIPTSPGGGRCASSSLFDINADGLPRLRVVTSLCSDAAHRSGPSPVARLPQLRHRLRLHADRLRAPAGASAGAFRGDLRERRCVLRGRRTRRPTRCSTSTATRSSTFVISQACADPTVGTTKWLVYLGQATGVAQTATDYPLPTTPVVTGGAFCLPSAGRSRRSQAITVPTFTLFDFDADGSGRHRRHPRLRRLHGGFDVVGLLQEQRDRLRGDAGDIALPEIPLAPTGSFPSISSLGDCATTGAPSYVLADVSGGRARRHARLGRLPRQRDRRGVLEALPEQRAGLLVLVRQAGPPRSPRREGRVAGGADEAPLRAASLRRSRRLRPGTSRTSRSTSSSRDRAPTRPWASRGGSSTRRRACESPGLPLVVGEARPYEPSVTLGAVVLFDGVCSLCNGAVQFLLDHERDASMRFAPLQSDVAERLLYGGRRRRPRERAPRRGWRCSELARRDRGGRGAHVLERRPPPRRVLAGTVAVARRLLDRPPPPPRPRLPRARAPALSLVRQVRHLPCPYAWACARHAFCEDAHADLPLLLVRLRRAPWRAPRRARRRRLRQLEQPRAPGRRAPLRLGRA